MNNTFNLSPIQNECTYDPTLRFFIEDSVIDWWNQHQVSIRMASVKIAWDRYVDKLVNQITH